MPGKPDPRHPLLAELLPSDPDAGRGEQFFVRFRLREGDGFWRQYSGTIYGKHPKQDLQDDESYDAECEYVKTKLVRRIGVKPGDVKILSVVLA